MPHSVYTVTSNKKMYKITFKTVKCTKNLLTIFSYTKFHITNISWWASTVIVKVYTQKKTSAKYFLA